MAEGKSRNKRWRVTSAETSFLEAVFLRTRKPSRATIEHLANSLAVRPRQVQVWFQNRRQRWRKEFSSETAFSPIDADAMQDGDTVHPASLDAIMRQFLGARPQHGGGHGGGSGGSASGGGHSTGGSDLREGDDDMDDFELDLDVDEDGVRSAGDSHDDRSATDRDAEAEQWRSLSRALNRPGGLSRRAGHATFSSDGAADEEEAAYLNDLASVLDIQPERDGARRAVDGDGEPDSDEALGKGAGSFGECDDDAESRVQQHAWSRIIGMDWLDGEEEGAAEGAADGAAAAGGTDAGGLAGAAENVALQFKVGAIEVVKPPPLDAQEQPADAGPQQPDERALRNSSSAQQLTQPQGPLVPPLPRPPSAAHAAAQPAPCSAPALPLAQPLFQILKSVSTASESVGCADAMLAAGAAAGAALPSGGGGWVLPLSSLAAGKSEASHGNEGFLTPTLRCGNAQAANTAGAHVAGAYAGAGAAGAGQELQSSAEAQSLPSLIDGAGVGGGSAELHCAAKAMAIASYLESVCDVLAI